jgi:hypothetical protein
MSIRNEKGRPTRMVAYTQAIEDMWPDDHDAICASDPSSENVSSSASGDSRKALVSSRVQWSAHATFVARALADMWPDEHEVMLALGEA